MCRATSPKGCSGNTITLGQTTFDKISLPTPTQRRAFDLIGAPDPLALK